MEVIRGIYNIRERHRGCVVTIGNFDGIHLGHQALLAQLKARGKQLGVPTLVIIFEPQPMEFLLKDNNVPRLMRFREKIEGLKEQGIDYVLCLRFNRKLALQTAEDFVQHYLIATIGAPYVLIGDDFRFGYQRRGNLALLQALGRGHFEVASLDTFKIQDERVSSTRIRQLLECGNLELAQVLLGRAFSMKGIIVKGDQRGRLLGFPTANICLYRKLIPLRGVFVVQMLGLNHQAALPGVANVGIRPTIGGQTQPSLEVHLLGFDQEIYGKRVEVRFLTKLRDELKFANLDELKQRILLDVTEAQLFFET
jgi:riboflavin kinase/FMN adenylyltransferase